MAKTILLADDSVTIQKVVELTFMDENFQVAAVGSGSEAIEWLDNTRPDLVIADVHMPGADGYRVCEHAKSRHAGLPVLLLVGTFEPFDEARASAVGADGHLKKPFDSQDLLARASRLTSGATESPEVAAPAVDAPAMDAPSFEFAEVQPAADAADHATRVFRAQDTEPVDVTTDPSTAKVDLIDLTPELTPDAGVPLETVAISTVSPEEVPPPPSQAETPAPEPVELAAADDESTDATEATAEIDFQTVASARAEAASRTASAAPAPAPGNGQLTLSDEDVERVARRVAELVADKAIREVAWEVVPDLAEVVIKERIRELESQLE